MVWVRMCCIIIIFTELPFWKSDNCKVSLGPCGIPIKGGHLEYINNLIDGIQLGSEDLDINAVILYIQHSILCVE